jgi:2-(1,2-epoxy-1,2-dihydrophenyl)acetyl-CoA isomerase
MDYQTLKRERFGGTVRITLSRPATYNAFDEQMGRELLEVMEACGRDAEVRAVILTGEGKAFCSGGDVRAMGEFVERAEAPPSVFFQGLTRYLHGIVVEMRRMPKPILAAVNGVAAGAGFSLAMACDLRIASEEACFTQAYTRLGLVPDGGSTFFLPRLVGPGRAAELVFLNPVLSAREALEWGLVGRVVPADRLQEEALEMADRLSKGPTKAFARAKELLNGSPSRDLESQLEAERRGIMEASLTQDFLEGLEAFLNKREPRFRGA